MKFGYAWTFVNKLRGGTPAPPPEKRTPALPRLPACRALSRQIGKGIFRAMLAVFRTGRRQHLAFGGHALSPGVPHPAAQQKRHNRWSYPPPARKTGLETMDWAALTARCAPACLRNPDWAASPQTPGSQPQISPLSVSRNRKPSAQLTAHGHEPQLPPPSHAGAPALLPPLAGSAMSESWRFRSLLSQDGQEGFSLEERTSFSNWCPQALQS